VCSVLRGPKHGIILMDLHPQRYNQQQERNAMTTSLLFAHETFLLLNNSIYKLSASISLHTLMQNVQTKSLLIV